MRILLTLLLVAVLTTAFSMTAFAAGDVAGAIESTWNAAKGQIQTVVNNVVFPVKLFNYPSKYVSVAPAVALELLPWGKKGSIFKIDYEKGWKNLLGST